MRRRACALTFGLLFLTVGLEAQIPAGMEGAFQPHPEAQEAISRIYSPFCPGFMLEVCPVAESVALRDSIQALAYEGLNADQLVAWVLANHGEEFRAVPQRSGWGIWAWLLPPLALLGGGVLVVSALRSFRPEEEAASDPSDPEGMEPVLSGAEEARLRSAIREIELSEDPSF